MGKGILFNEWRNGLCFLSWKKNPQMYLFAFDWLLHRDPQVDSMNYLLLREWLEDSDSASVERGIISRLQNTYTFMCPMCIPMDRGHLQMKIGETNELLILHSHLNRLCIKAWLFIYNLRPGPQTRPVDSSVSGQRAWKCVQSASCTVEYRGGLWFPKSKVLDALPSPQGYH